MSALRACRFGDRWELVRDIDGIGRRVGIVHDKADADRLIASEDLLAAVKDLAAYARSYGAYHREKFYAPGTVVDGIDKLEEKCAAAEAAIAKAEGRS